MFDLFPDQPVFEYPTLVNVLYSLIWAFVLSSIIAITHKVTFTGPQYPRNFFQAIALGSIVAAMVMMAIGDSLARGLGAFGALAIIRFRTRIQDARNIIFIFAGLSVGLSIGVFGYTISFVGTMIFCTGALILHFSPFSTKAGDRGRVLIRITSLDVVSGIEKTLSKFCSEFNEVQIIHRSTGTVEVEYAIELKVDADKRELTNAIAEIEGVSRTRITVKDMLEEN
ncbi:MAG: DUF4956 domain-containing protein [Balneola sp.]|nr:MAG: DUF4956 domain-containing protein [Balneola sp.]